jgi:hypothetical protein
MRFGKTHEEKERAGIQKKFAWWPRRAVSGRWIWLETYLLKK